MAEPNTAYLFEYLILAVAEYASIANYDSTDGDRYVPTDKFELNYCKRIVNAGIKMFMEDQPRKGWRWMRRIMSVTFAPTYTGTASGGTAATLIDDGIEDEYDDDYFNGYLIYITAGTGKDESATITDYTGSSGTFAFTALSGGSTPDTTSEYTIATSTNAINGDGARYKLPTNFGGTTDGKIAYSAGSAHGTRIEWVDESRIRSLREVSVNSGYPSLAAVRAYEPTSATLTASRRWELIVDPRPSAALTVEFPYTLYFDGMKMETGVADSTSDTTLVDATRLEPDDYFNDWVITVVAGTGKGSYATVTDYTKATGTFTVADWLDQEGNAAGTNPAASSIYRVEPAANLHPCGHQFDNAIYAACLARAEMEPMGDDLGEKWQNIYVKKSLPGAKAKDQRSAPRTMGYFGNGPVRRRERTWSDVTTDNDV